MLTHYDHLRDYELHLALLKSDEDENFDVIEDIHLTYAEAKILRAYLNRPEVGRWLDKAE